MGLKNFENCLAIIKSMEDNSVTKSMVTAHYTDYMTIDILDSLDHVKAGSNLSVLIIHDEGASEFSGVTRKKSKDGCEISLYREREREARASTRYTINSVGSIRKLKSNGEEIFVDPPITVVVHNISTTGILVREASRLFATGDILDINMLIDGDDVLMHGQVVRMQINEDNSICFGCKLVFPG